MARAEVLSVPVSPLVVPFVAAAAKSIASWTTVGKQSEENTAVDDGLQYALAVEQERQTRCGLWMKAHTLMPFLASIFPFFSHTPLSR